MSLRDMRGWDCESSCVDRLRTLLSSIIQLHFPACADIIQDSPQVIDDPAGPGHAWVVTGRVWCVTWLVW